MKHFLNVKWLFGFLILLLATPSFALIDLRLTYGINTVNANLSDLGAGDEPKPVPLTGLGGDFIFSPPLVPLGFGIRYEKMGAKAASDDFSVQMDMTRTAAIVNFRIIDTLIMVGPIFTFGLNHPNTFEVKNGSTTLAKFESKKASSYSAGLEVGLKVPFLLGIELGYMSMTAKDAENKTTPTAAKEDIDLSGGYTKVFLGFGF
ncbi:MAG: hypothetical protein AB7O96_10765 [Pseudobdellovibrionaceae bacterium]